MGCNAWNHPANCDCGWGGATRFESGFAEKKDQFRASYFHLAGQITASANAQPRLIEPTALANGRRWDKAGVLNIPNATCPVCGQPVFFIETQNGGRVFFDELGPPWPKHPCIDNDTAYISVYANTFPHPQAQPTHSPQSWHILAGPVFDRSNGMLNIKGYASTLKKFLMVRHSEDSNDDCHPPVLVRPSQDGTIEVSYLASSPGSNQLSPRSDTFLPSATASDEIWQEALRGEASAENSVGWSFSFFWDKFGGKHDSAKNHEASRYWFARSALHGDGQGMNNYAVQLLKGLGGPQDERLAEELLLKSALQLTPMAFGHLGKLWAEKEVSERTVVMSQLFLALERHFSFEESLETFEDVNGTVESECIQAVETGQIDKEYCYAPFPMERYFHIEVVRKIASVKNNLPLWNLLWLSSEGLDESVLNPAVWHQLVFIPRGLVQTLLLDLDTAIATNKTLREILTLHPRRFLHYFAAADVTPLEVFMREGNRWRNNVTSNGESAAARISESVCAPIAAIHSPNFGANRPK